MSEHTAASLENLAQRAEEIMPASGNYLQTTLGACANVCRSYAALLDADAQPADDAAVQRAIESISYLEEYGYVWANEKQSKGLYEDAIILLAAYRAKRLRVVNLGGQLLEMQKIARQMEAETAERNEVRAKCEELYDRVAELALFAYLL